MKKLFVLTLVVMLALMLVVTVSAGSATKNFRSAALHYSGTGWGGWSCPENYPFIVKGKVKDTEGVTVDPSTLLVSQAAKPGVSPYPVYPHYTYTPPEEGWVVQNNTKEGRTLFIIITCRQPYEVCDETIRWPNTVVFSEWSEFVWDAGRGLYVSTRIKTVTKTLADLYDQKHICRQWDVYYDEERTRGPDEVIVGASFGCSSPDEDGIVYQLQGGVTINPGGDATLTLDGMSFTASEGMHLAFGSYSWSAVAAEGHTIAGDSSGSFKLTDSNCNDPSDPPEEHPATGPESALAVPVAAGVAGLTLLAMGIRLYSKRREE